QVVEAANRVDGRTDLHQRAQIPGHLVERVVKTYLHRGAAQHAGLVEFDVTRFGSCFALVFEKEKLRIADPHTIAVLETASSHRHVVYESAVEAIEIGDDEIVVFFLDSGVTARDGGIGNAEVRGGLATDDERVVDVEDGALQFACDGCDTRRHFRQDFTRFYKIDRIILCIR